MAGLDGESPLVMVTGEGADGDGEDGGEGALKIILASD